jgi:hypothetical protein
MALHAPSQPGPVRTAGSNGASGELTMLDLVGVGVLTAPSFVLPVAVGPSFEALALSIGGAVAGVAWLVRRSFPRH